MSRSVSTFAVVYLVIALGACSKKPPESLPPAPTETLSDTSPRGSIIIPGSQADFIQQMGGQDVIYFDTDRFNIDDIDAVALQAQAQWLRRYPNKRAIIEGHADERGTREYNLALGERRANSAKNYLLSLGIDASRLATVSYGKERPLATASNEAAWAQNRRAVTITID